MVALFLTTTITCAQALSILSKIKAHLFLSDHVKTELIQTIRETIPTCPVKVKPDEK